MAWNPESILDNHLLETLAAAIRTQLDEIAAMTDANLIITNAKVSPTADIVDTKLHQITTPGKVSGAAFTLLASVPGGAGLIPIANIPNIPGSKLTTLASIASAAGFIPIANIPSTVVKTSGNQTIADVKTFTSIPVLPAVDPTSGNQATRKDYVDGVKIKYVKVSDQVASGVAAQANATGTWTTKRINTENHDDGSLCSIASNQITLAAGTYFCRIASPVHYEAGHHQARLRNITDTETALIGSSEYQHTDHDRGTQCSIITGQFTIAVETVFEVQHYKAGGTAWGFPADFGEDEVYTVAEFWKVS